MSPNLYYNPVTLSPTTWPQPLGLGAKIHYLLVLYCFFCSDLIHLQLATNVCCSSWFIRVDKINFMPGHVSIRELNLTKKGRGKAPWYPAVFSTLLTTKHPNVLKCFLWSSIFFKCIEMFHLKLYFLYLRRMPLSSRMRWKLPYLQSDFILRFAMLRHCRTTTLGSHQRKPHEMEMFT